MHLGNWGSLCAPILGLLVFLVIYVELGQEIFDVTFVLDGNKAILEILSEFQILVYVSLAWCISASSTS